MGKCKAKAIQTDLGTFRYNQLYSIPCANLANQSRSISRNMTYSKPETYSEPWFIQNPGVLKTVAYSKLKAYSDIYNVKHLR